MTMSFLFCLEQTGWMFLCVGVVYLWSYGRWQKHSLILQKQHMQHTLTSVGWIFLGGWLLFASTGEISFGVYVFTCFLLLCAFLVSGYVILGYGVIETFLLTSTYHEVVSEKFSQADKSFLEKRTRRNVRIEDFLPSFLINNRILWMLMMLQTLRTLVFLYQD